MTSHSTPTRVMIHLPHPSRSVVMSDTAETVSAIAKGMLDEELVMILDRLKDGHPATILQQAVAQEAKRRQIGA